MIMNRHGRMDSVGQSLHSFTIHLMRRRSVDSDGYGVPPGAGENSLR